MKFFYTYLCLIGILPFFCSFNADIEKGKRVQAEDMSLTNYTIDSIGSTTFIKLTSTKGSAKFRFSLPSARYDIEARYLSEKIGQNTYAIYLNGVQIISWLGKNRDEKWHTLTEQKWHTPKNIPINFGDEIRIEALSGNGSLVILDYIEFTESGKTPSATKENLVSIYPEEYNNAIKNPLKGFRSTLENEHEYGTLIKTYFKWNELESVATDDVNKIKKVSDLRWVNCEKKNIKLIPRVYLAWPGKESGWPADMKQGDFTSDQFKKRVITLIKKLGKAWDNDSRVAYVEMGIVGEWGEMEFPDTREDIKEAIAAQFAASFQNKLVMIRWPNTYNDDVYNFGYYWDSWGHYDQNYYGFHLNNLASKWKTVVIGGEAAYDWGNWLIQPGRNPDSTVSKAIHRDYMINQIRKLHANHMGWIADYNQNDKNVRAGAEFLQKAMGYQFLVTEVTYPKKIDNNTNFTVSFKVKNTGSSPIYYNWPVEVSLLDPKTKQPVWKNIYNNLDIRSWLPGDQWNAEKNIYTLPADHNIISQTFSLSNVPTGEYILALAILDPAGMQPSARFTIKNYYNGGRHPIGKVGVNKTINSFSITEFDDIQSDKSLFYEKVVK